MRSVPLQYTLSWLFAGLAEEMMGKLQVSYLFTALIAMPHKKFFPDSLQILDVLIIVLFYIYKLVGESEINSLFVSLEILNLKIKPRNL